MIKMRKTAEDPDIIYVKSFQQNHDRKSFEFLYDKYKDGIFNYCSNYLKDEDDAADCTQEIFLRVFRNIDGFRFRSRFSTWLFRITINSCHNFFRSKAGTHHGISVSMQEQVTEPSPDPERALAGKEIVQAFREGLSRLKEHQRRVIILRDLEGMSYDEIARINGMKAGTVRSTLARARYRMAEYLKEYKNGM